MTSHRVSLSPPSPCADTPPIAACTTATPHISFTPGLDTYLKSLTPGQVASPAGPPLRVKQVTHSKHGGRRLDPLAVSLIELVVSKGTADILKRPIFPYSYATEPLRCMEIRTHLLRRYAALPPQASHSALVAATKELLHLWGATLFNPADDPVCSSSVQDPQTIDLSRMVSPLKRKNNNNEPPIQKVTNNYAGDLSPFIVKDGSMGIFPHSVPKDTQVREPEAEEGRHSSESTKAPRAEVRAEVPVSQRVLGKDVLCGKLSALKRDTTAKKKVKAKKKGCAARLAVQRLIRRWCPAERALYLKALEEHGWSSTDTIHRMIPGK